MRDRLYGRAGEERMFDTNTSCLIRGLVGVIFGILALLLPETTRTTFYLLFWILIIIGIAIFIFLAITARAEESMLWFGLSALLLIIGVVSIIFAGFIALLFILIILAVAIYNGFTDITLALTHPKTKYILIPVMILSACVVLGALFYYFPDFEKNLFLSIAGTFALIFGLYSILFGFYRPDEENTPPTIPAGTCGGNDRKH